MMVGEKGLGLTMAVLTVVFLSIFQKKKKNPLNDPPPPPGVYYNVTRKIDSERLTFFVGRSTPPKNCTRA